MLKHKAKLYRHLYSYSSVKIVVHWLQIIKNKKFQMFEDSPDVIPLDNSNSQVPNYPTKNIKTPIALFWGGCDTLPDIEYILRNIPDPVLCIEIEEYEHLQFLWGTHQSKTTFPAILGLLDEHSEVWSDAPDHCVKSSDCDLIRRVDWISEDDIKNVLGFGRAKSIGSDGEWVVFEIADLG